MSATVMGVVDTGAEAALIDIECHLSNGLPNIVIVGLANKAVDEAKERIRSAFAEAGLQLPKKRITINLAPADLPKDGAGLDLAIAIAILIASKQLGDGSAAKQCIVGELGLDGSVRPVRGVIGKLLAGRKHGIRSFIIPPDNLSQATLVPDITLIPAHTLKELYLSLSGTNNISPVASGHTNPPPSGQTAYDFSEVVGQARAKRVMEVAAAGGHNVLLSGPPGTGKSMLAKALPSILPPLTADEMLEVTHLHSLANRHFDQVISERPFRSPHHTASEVSILGGGQNPRPGEVSLAHLGILLFDEFPEYGRSVIEALRQPLEDHQITVARAKDTVTYPARFMFIATSNPCPCGYYGSSKACTCAPYEIIRYQRKLSGPILDRIDLYITVDEVDHARLLSMNNETAERSDSIRKRVVLARQAQYERYKKPTITNATLSNVLLKRHANLSTEAKSLLDRAAKQLDISARAYMRIVKVARTIADLDQQPHISQAEISEALQYRRPASIDKLV